MLRTWRSPMPPASAASAGIAFLTSGDAATSAWRVIAPIVLLLPEAWAGRHVIGAGPAGGVGARGAVWAGAGFVVAVVGERLPGPRRQSAVHLPVDDHRVDQLAEVVDRGEVDDPGLAGVGIDLDL